MNAIDEAMSSLSHRSRVPRPRSRNCRRSRLPQAIKSKCAAAAQRAVGGIAAASARPRSQRAGQRAHPIARWSMSNSTTAISSSVLALNECRRADLAGLPQAADDDAEQNGDHHAST